ncbi:MAG: efflux RND transporter periplasmic adaptor subunit [Lunatimonas sp.]|uniref:efflux RND transporter periplasmic adaptor subunit n=1 Tax=Lunatimonas sp. TaxID=2060141 RepID=UPI00263B9223|nr:efflux RND transporter periplasmic adaptor subunit [Lunatimonas sp.]MCC5937962.1 efflux RND transporter periplasmic adaptor subunit [Lunatimonas sp.]
MIETTKNLAIFLCLLSCLSCTKQAPKEEKPTTVTVDLAKLETVKEENTYPGTIVALKEVELRADVVGYVIDIPVKDGQQVTKGQVLYRIDQTRYTASLNQATSRLRIAQSNHERVQRDLSRYERLKEGNAVAAQIYDDARTAMSNAEQELISAQAEVDNAKVNLDYATVRAPFDGTIGFSSVRLGALVNPGQTALNVISSNDPIGLDFFADEKSLPFYFEMEKNEELAARDSVFQLTMANREAYPFPGKIENIDRAVDPGTGTIQIRLSFPNPDGLLKPGMSTRLTVRKPVEGQKITVPHRALVERLGEIYVFAAAEGKAEQKRVRTGIRTKDRIVIEDGLEEGQQVIVAGIQRLSDGDPIQLKREENQ